jgi:hypothetical protein
MPMLGEVMEIVYCVFEESVEVFFRLEVFL